MKFSKKAQRHAKLSRQRTKRMLREAKRKNGPVTISYLPGFEPPASEDDRLTRTKFPFAATINGRPCIVWPDWIEYPDGKEEA